MPELYIPPQELSFKLFGYASKKYLFGRTFNMINVNAGMVSVRLPDRPEIGHSDGPSDDEPYWNLIPGTGEYAGCYLIKSKDAGKVLFSRTHMKPHIGLTDTNGAYPDNWFRLEPGTGKFANHFRLRNFSSDRVIISRTHAEPQVDHYPGSEKPFPDNYFSFVFEDTKVTDIKYKIDQGKVQSAAPMVLGSATQTNSSSVDQTVEFTFSEAQTVSSTFEYTSGFSVTIGATVKFGIPLIGEGELKTEVSSSQEYKWGESNSTTKTFASRFPATAPPYKKVVATFKAKRAEITVPFTLYSESVETGYKVTTEGVYRGVTFWDIQSDIKEMPL